MAGTGAAAPPPSTAYAAPSATPPGAAAAAAAGSCSDQVFAIFNGPQGASDQGVHVNEVVGQVNGRFSSAQVREAVEHLVGPCRLPVSKPVLTVHMLSGLETRT
jgi:replication factor A2